MIKARAMSAIPFNLVSRGEFVDIFGWCDILYPRQARF